MSIYIKNEKLLWLGLNLFMVISMIVIGGITRLTDSGLSMTNWNLIKGIIPPLNQSDWNNLFDLYKQYPEYNLKNSEMSLFEFKKIFFWEYLHRMWGRFIGLTFFLPMIYFWVKGKFKTQEKKLIILLSLLGFFQAFMGWFMVESGLVDRPDVSHFRLSAHLLTAFLIYSLLLYFFWIIFSKNISNYNQKISKLKSHKNNFYISLFLLLSTVFAGALVSGTDAGLAYNNFPLMLDHLLPPILIDEKVFYFKTLLYDQGFLQFTHRLFATLTLLFVLHTVVKAHRDSFFDDFKKLYYSLLIVIVVQYTLGVIILKLYVPIFLGLMHQIGALTMLSLIIVSICELNKKNGAKIAPFTN